ncbi:MAG: M48 family metalloprotease [Alphaproteobacteria bacterium]|nr:M48 family metalloprotease [Alphaproteobacteria bacterium]MCB9691984.1 M48 family metalloprotease [Alphaproteobacteria bacterium]
MNYVKTAMLLGLLSAFLVAIGGVIGGQQGMLVMLVLAGVMNFGSWFFADSLVIASTGAQPVSRDEIPWLYEDMEEIARAAGIPTPRLYWVGDPSPNAFATGRSPSKGVVAVTQGLLDQLDRREIRGVIAHEIGHIQNRDTLISAVAGTIAGAISYAAHMIMWTRDRDTPVWLSLIIMILAPMAAAVIQMSISRTREYAADRRAAQLTGDPEGLASALSTLAYGVQRVPMEQTAGEHVHMIVNGFSGGLAGWFSTHPPIEERIKRLRQMDDV